MIKFFLAFLRTRYGQLYLKKKLDKAITIFETGILKYPNYPFLFLHLGLAYTQKQNWKKAEYYVEKACNIDPSNPIFDLFLGKVLIDGQNYDKAISVLQESIDKDKNNQLSWGYLALAHLGEKNYKEFHDIVDKKPLSENHELQIRMILLLEKQIRNNHELQSFSISE